MVGKGWRLSPRARLNECAEAGFTHLIGECAACRAIRRKPFDDIEPFVKLNTIQSYAAKNLRCPCGGRIDPRTVWVWAENITYRGPR